MSIPTKVAIEVTDQMIQDQLISAIEGGINYWCKNARQIKGTGADIYEIMRDGTEWKFTASDDEQPKHTLTRESIAAGLQLMATKYPKHFNDVVTEHGDASTADIFVQCCLFDDLIYG